jgi:ABC-type Mn2+/Zn2+ transport system permease subunit
MNERGAAFFYRTATILAGLVAALAVISYFLNAPRGMPIVSIAALTLAAVIWISGWAGRHLIAGR